MMRRALLCLATLALSTQFALAQYAQQYTNFNYIVPTAPGGTNNNQAASTAFVIANAVGGGAVSSVFGRNGGVTAQANDYNFNQLAGSLA
jgi:hypothetical protein